MRVGPAGTAVEASSHSIVTTSRELFYWLAVLVTFALGTAVGDWVLDLTGWGPGVSVLLPAGLIAAVTLGRRLGANAVLSFWLACIPTRPLGANLGDWRAPPRRSRARSGRNGGQEDDAGEGGGRNDRIRLYCSVSGQFPDTLQYRYCRFGYFPGWAGWLHHHGVASALSPHYPQAS